jgi:hypothetical protein
MKARGLLLGVLTQEPADAKQWIKLARIHQRLDELPEALRDVRIALQLEPASHEAFVLAMDIAFRGRFWEDFVTFVRGALAVLPDLAEAHASFQEWVALQPDLVGASNG